ncbi:MAG: secondary thiamine-phosphate synthase enzyme YjbQ [Pseudomonadota bacterium]
MIKKQTEFVIQTTGRSLTDITPKVKEIVTDCRLDIGICHIFIKHTSASLIVTENADLDVKLDLEDYFKRLVLDGDKHYRHRAEGDDDMASHIRSVLTQTNLAIPISEKQLNLGSWQGIYLWEHRYCGYSRHVVVTVAA